MFGIKTLQPTEMLMNTGEKIPVTLEKNGIPIFRRT